MDNRIVESIAAQTQINATRLPPTQNRQQLETNWQVMKDRIDHIVDKLGRGIDEGIKEPVIALNLLGVNTGGSCEGHMPTPKHNSPYPYIDIEAKETKELKALGTKREEALQLARAKLEAKAPEELVTQLFNNYHELDLAIRKMHLIETRKVIELLKEFYAIRQVPFERRLIAKIEGAGNCKIKPQAGDLQDLEGLAEEKQEKLQEYQEEIRTFSSFLKAKYFAEEK